MINDGLWDVFNHTTWTPPLRTSRRNTISGREDQDLFAAASQNAAEAAQKAGKFKDEIVTGESIPARSRHPTCSTTDEYIRAGATPTR